MPEMQWNATVSFCPEGLLASSGTTLAWTWSCATYTKVGTWGTHFIAEDLLWLSYPGPAGLTRKETLPSLGLPKGQPQDGRATSSILQGNGHLYPLYAIGVNGYLLMLLSLWEQLDWPH